MTVTPTTYEEFFERATVIHGEGWARLVCPDYARNFARECREKAAASCSSDAVELRRLADQMDPDLRTGAPTNAAPL